MAQDTASKSRPMIISPPPSMLEVDEVLVLCSVNDWLLSVSACHIKRRFCVRSTLTFGKISPKLTLKFSLLNSASITSSITQWEWENGRRYHAYKAGSYAFPNDEVCTKSPLGAMQLSDAVQLQSLYAIKH